MYNLQHWGYEVSTSHNLTHPAKFENPHLIEKLRWLVLKQPRYAGRVYKKDYPDALNWGDAEYFTFYKGRGKTNNGDRMVVFYAKERTYTKEEIQKMEWGENDEPLY